jgi:guanylate kinase
MIIGKSFSGKDTLLNKILSDKEFCEKNNLERLVRYTTRKQRPGEVDGVDYHFISDEEFKNYAGNADDIVISSYNSEYGLLHYWTDFGKLESGKNYIAVSDVESIEDYKKILGNRLCLIYLLPPDWVLFERFSKRDDNSEYDELKYKEIHRRYIDDLMKFGKKSNTFLANCNSIILVGRNYRYDLLLYYMSYLSLRELESEDSDYLSFIIANDKVFPYINANYEPDRFYSVSDIEDITKCKIMFRNGDIIIDINEEKVSKVLL